MFINGPILTIFNFEKKIIVETDINKIVLGAVLSQLDETKSIISGCILF